ncbi:MAG: M20/M25/M40 family metallo-hydrolase, partial [Pseudomonadota bacterium]
MTARLTPLELMTQLVRFPTVSRDTNLPLIDWVDEYLTSHNITCHRHLKPDEPKAALFAHVGPEVEGAVVLSGHTDVVPIDGQDWDTDPFDVVARDGKYFGRGTCDMKGFDALAIWALVEAHHAGKPLQIALSYDEEIGCAGAPPLIDAMAGVIPKGGPVIVGEPSMMKAVTGHKGGQGFDTHVIGFEVHSSLLPQGVSAIHEAARLIDFANQRNVENMAATPSAMAAMFDPPFTTWHVG